MLEWVDQFAPFLLVLLFFVAAGGSAISTEMSNRRHERWLTQEIENEKVRRAAIILENMKDDE